MVDGFYKAVCSELRAHGFVYVKNAKGSHEKWHCGKTDVLVLVPRNLLSRHTANGILEDAGIDKRF